MKKISIIILTAAFFTPIILKQGFAQLSGNQTVSGNETAAVNETAVQQAPSPQAIQNQTAAEVPKKPASSVQDKVVWGEVTSVDKNKISVKYLDFDNPQSGEEANVKEIAIDIDDKTSFENIGSVSDIKPQDTVSVYYTATPDGKNIAKSISLEKADEQELVPDINDTGTPPPQPPEEGQ